MAATGEARPDPDALLALARQERRGRLTVFLGAAPGVGKTYAMLSRAQRLKAEGIDIVVGLVETHGRSRDRRASRRARGAAAAKPVSYHGHTIEEFDLDAALARRPTLIIVDELAHTNAPDSRHPKRYQDVEELLDAGIDVWTALNIQHLESLSDVVSSDHRRQVRERVPDIVHREGRRCRARRPHARRTDRAAQGGQGLSAGQCRAAPPTVSSRPAISPRLRELALRRTADRVDDQMVDYLRQNAIEGPWPTAERLLVCVGPDPNSQAVLRSASRLANGLNGSWVALHVQSAGARNSTMRRRSASMTRCNLADRLGAETARACRRAICQRRCCATPGGRTSRRS